jgi:hypothetical protein
VNVQLQHVVAGTPWPAGTWVFNALYPEAPLLVTRDFTLDVPMRDNKDAKLYTALDLTPLHPAPAEWARPAVICAALLGAVVSPEWSLETTVTL